MDLDQLTTLREGLNLFAGTINEVARRADVTPTYVGRVLRGQTKSNPTTLLIIEKAKEVYNEYTQKNNAVSASLAALD